MRLSTDAGPVWPAGYDKRHLDETDSTNAAALRLIPDIAGPTWVTATRQTAARGRRGRAWHQPEGNLAASLALRLTAPPTVAALRSFSAALAVAETLEAHGAAPDDVTLKWPNDVLLQGRKAAGILLESRAMEGGMLALAVGIGINLAIAPPQDRLDATALPAISLAEAAGAAPTPGTALDVLAEKYAHWEDLLGTYGFAPLRAAWLARAARLGQKVTARLPGESVTGIFETIDADGSLILRGSAGSRPIAAAEVFF
ncbi:MAG: biotin--[acetyl-CoA-carboxylase] ligase [Pseudomonadota bacterium]